MNGFLIKRFNIENHLRAKLNFYGHIYHYYEITAITFILIELKTTVNLISTFNKLLIAELK